MIDELETFKKFGYYSKDLKLKSNKKVIFICECKRIFIKPKSVSDKVCKSCSLKKRWKEKPSWYTYKMTDAHRIKIGLANKGKIKSKEAKEKYSLSKIGKLNPNYKHGVSDLTSLIYKSAKYRDWRTKIFERDYYTCQDCGRTNCYLEAHHKVLFFKLFIKFLKKYPHLSFKKDKEQLLLLSKNYRPFWNLKNGLTLCKSCHIKTYESKHYFCAFKKQENL